MQWTPHDVQLRDQRNGALDEQYCSDEDCGHSMAACSHEGPPTEFVCGATKKAVSLTPAFAKCQFETEMVSKRYVSTL
jgi:hypothetical protein